LYLAMIYNGVFQRSIFTKIHLTNQLTKGFILLVTVILLHTNSTVMAQGLPYKEIPSYPADYTPGNIVARTIDGLGYRYYWATEGLSEHDLNFKPSDDARTTLETLEHLYGLSDMIYNAASGKPNHRPADFSGKSLSELRQITLNNLLQSSILMAEKTAEDIAKLNIVFKNERGSNEFAYWHMLNGPLADALYHTGQVVSFRRSSGNPMNPKVNVFMGKTR
ncbi:MAG: hypothetical protein AAFO69_09825, partial [Bacteroidota bacterium]